MKRTSPARVVRVKPGPPIKFNFDAGLQPGEGPLGPRPLSERVVRCALCGAVITASLARLLETDLRLATPTGTVGASAPEVLSGADGPEIRVVPAGRWVCRGHVEDGRER